MAICDDCGQEMMNPAVAGCDKPRIRVNGTLRNRIRFGLDEDRTCHDCNARPGALHHYGCDMERCPVCEGQLISCDCRKANAPSA